MKNPLGHRWTISIVLLTILAVSGCGQKADESAKVPASGESAPPTSPEKDTTTKTSSTDGTLSAEAEKLGVKPEGETTCPSNSPVKGVVTKKRGNIYRAPKSPDYEKVKPNICFADVATAEKAGFSAPK
ncbi:hypothetical protein [Brasilonema sp. UFV-L1]|uniref:sunset domain-containing protein n=1 Tax=Brasilonema sp. UFV-L1 TaxID=2234130 RepID=UPI00145F6615|nr:hypothetical protein [Brasilonema sp. UFV-L1]NMG11466.1 hypothetical protein [Brasilonema sp. UFV-L1]